MANVIDSLKRLERAGSEESKATAKLRDAASKLSEHLCQTIDLRTRQYSIQHSSMPRGYAFIPRYGDGQVLAQWDRTIQGWRPVNESRETALALAANVATGWLGELADWLETRRAEACAATCKLEIAKSRAEFSASGPAPNPVQG